eukprot:CAMPEP_0171705374 /NCGR_PEP_ID=MMETSP0991-20121206/13157_1 /TAXON_ID=483369 /ORGANISM="non described non described, Strain CCMP2098" /LENGTH=76 /DNA_ID=CAMNT_0012294903 /DNA_START=685 /DNA_END=915 /DNA_ORIENTATION=-
MTTTLSMPRSSRTRKDEWAAPFETSTVRGGGSSSGSSGGAGVVVNVANDSACRYTAAFLLNPMPYADTLLTLGFKK